eukprot:TRINITY_DN1647_c0_g1_i3.p1 TRINITY_DN1647_c0_g1~~TRINITY_DN1647_c0_g1_i3.p1  ORF type:complete len:958 (-),score=294.74 TRINITY_DN1647_c0_g1_i3:8-2881(-)
MWPRITSRNPLTFQRESQRCRNGSQQVKYHPGVSLIANNNTSSTLTPSLPSLSPFTPFFSENVRAYTQMQPIGKMDIPVKVNLLFIGFNEKGRNKLHLSRDELSPWFEHIEHLLHHTTVPFRGGDVLTKEKSSVFSHVRYSYALNVIEVDPLVTKVYENMINMHRREEPITMAMKQTMKSKLDRKYYVDASQLEDTTDCLLRQLGIDKEYNLVILNPDTRIKAKGEHVYGYRTGFSDGEIDQLFENPQIGKALRLHKRKSKGGSDGYFGLCSNRVMPGMIPPKTEEKKQQKKQQQEKNDGHGHSHGKKKSVDNVKYEDMKELSEEWARGHIAEQEKLDKMDKDASKRPPSAQTCQRHVSTNKAFDIQDVAYRWIVSGTKRQREYVRKVHTLDTMRENCLVDTWLSKKRFMIIDLAAGPFNWGPVIGGEGVRCAASLPNVSHAFEIHKQKEEASYQAMSVDEKDKLAEKDVVETFWGKFCAQYARNQLPEFCREIQERLKQLELSVKGASAAMTQVQDKLKDSTLLGGSENEGLGAKYGLDSFLAHVGTTISSALRHVITPSTPSFKTFFAERVTFNIYMIVDHTRYKATDRRNFNLKAFKRQMTKFKLPGQHFSFVVHRIPMTKDHALSMAFTSSLKSAVVPTMDLRGRFRTKRRLYVDSSILEAQLANIKRHKHARKLDKHVERSNQKHREVPIFLFSMFFNHKLPVFIDKYWQAKALRDMVIAVQSEHTEWSSHTSCNGKEIYLNLRNPLKNTLASTALHYAGVLPSHMAYSDAHQQTAQNWQWSVGDNPLATTSFYHEFSRIQIDTAHRHFVVNALDTAAEQINQGLAILQKLETGDKNYYMAANMPLSEITEVYQFVRRLEMMTIFHAGELDFKTALRKAGTMLEKANTFVKLCKRSAELMHSFQCLEIGKADVAQDSNDDIEWMTVIVVLVDVLLALLIWMFRDNKRKVKFN